MKKLVLLIALLTFPLFLFSADKWDSIIIDAHKRDYKVHVPKSYDKSKAVPLIIAVHGGGGQAWSMEKLTKFSVLSEKEGFIVVYPEGFEKQWNDGREVLQISAQRKNINDVGFISKVIDKVAEKYSIDKKKVYAAGISNGGFMCQRLACELSDKLAAVVSVSAAMPEKIKDKCRPANRISVMFINGTEDPLVPYDGGSVKVGKKERGEITSTEESVALWVNRNGCQKVKSDVIKTDLEVDCDYYRDKQGTEVVLYTVKGGGHTWPGGPQYLPQGLVGKVCKGMDATGEIWKFFQRHNK